VSQPSNIRSCSQVCHLDLSLLILLLGVVGSRDGVGLLLRHGVLLLDRRGRLDRLLLELASADRVGGCCAGGGVQAGLAVTVEHDAVGC